MFYVDSVNPHAMHVRTWHVTPGSAIREMLYRRAISHAEIRSDRGERPAPATTQRTSAALLMPHKTRRAA